MSSSQQEERETLVSNHSNNEPATSSSETTTTSMVAQTVPNNTTTGTRLKVILLGDTAVGKTSIVARFLYDAFDRNYRATLGIDFLTKLVTVDGKTIRLQIWDTAGQERFKSLSGSYIRNSNGCIVVFDICSRESFVNVTSWIEHVKQEKTGTAQSDIIFFLVGNKIDLGEKRVVTTEEAETKAKEIGASYCEVSAKNGANIKQLFRKVATTIPLPQIMATPGDDQQQSSNNRISGGLGQNNIRRIDPLLVTPARTSDAVANQSNNNSQGGGGMCGAC